jgi:hypothetical protein
MVRPVTRYGVIANCTIAVPPDANVVRELALLLMGYANQLSLV